MPVGYRELYGKSSLLDGKWHHVVYTHDEEVKRMYFDGELEAEEFIGSDGYSSGNVLTIGGRLATSYDHRGWNGRIDDCRLYDHAVTYAEVREMAGNYKAFLPVPSDGEQDVSRSLGSIWWESGVRAGGSGNLHKVYFGTNKALVEANDVSVYKGQFDSNSYSGAPMGSLSAGVDYYWKVNAVNGVDEWPGNVWSFRTLSLKASEPRPVDTSKYVGTTRTRVYWRAGGEGATDHAVYFGTDETLVTNGDASVYKVIISDFSDYNDPNWLIDTALVADEKYYWRIDVNAPVVYQGDIWSFTASTPEADPNFIAWWKFDEKSGNLVYDATGREHHGILTQGAANTSIDIVYDADMDSNVLDYNNPPNHILGSAVDAGGDPCDIIDPCWADIQTAITVAGWAKLDEMHTTNLLLSKNGSYQLSSTADTPVTDARDGRVRAYTDDGVFDDSETYSYTSVSDGEWHHLAFTYDSGTKQRIVYIDGDRENAETLEKSPDDDDDVFPLIGVSTETLVIGGRLQPGFNYRGWNGLVKDVRIYDRALSRNELHVIGVTDVNKAWGPYPRTAADPVTDRPLQLYWIPGDNVQGTQGHKVYFGTDEELVDANHASVLLGTYDSNTAPAPSLTWTETYYWKVNELNGATEWPGKVWWFRMGNYIPWDDFESYGFGIDDLIGLTWKPVAWTGGAINLGQSIELEPTYDDSSQSMKYEYDNQISYYYYHSETYRDFGGSPQDWSYATGGVKSLRLYFYGLTGNDPDDMYVVLDDGSNESMKLYDRNLDDLKAGKWKYWDIDLSWFTAGANNVNLASVQRVYIGFGERGTMEYPTTQLAGTVYFDDFRVYPPHCVPERLKPDGDVSEDCFVDYVDAEQMAYRWLDNDYSITPSNPTDSNLVGYWNFDDGTANDSSGNTRHGTLIEGHEATSAAFVYDTDRDSNVLEVDNPDDVLNSVVDCGGGTGDTSEPNWAYLKEQISIAAWFKVDTFFQEDQYMLTRGGSYQVRRYTTTDDMGCWMGSLGDTTLRSDSAYSSSDVDDGKWHHVVFTYDSDVNERIVYIDGRVAGTDEPNGPLLYHENGFVIGGRIDPNFNDRGWDGWIDEVRLYDDVLTHEEVVYIMTGSTSPHYFPVWSLGNLTDTGDPVNSRFVNFKDYNILADMWFDELLWPSGW